jgi:tetratricopeptide (TPR) repeat protein
MSFCSRLVYLGLAVALAFTGIFEVMAGENPSPDTWTVVAPTPLTVPSTPAVQLPAMAPEVPPPGASWIGEITAAPLSAPATPLVTLPIPPEIMESPVSLAGIGAALEASSGLAAGTLPAFPIPHVPTNAIPALEDTRMELFRLIVPDLAASQGQAHAFPIPSAITGAIPPAEDIQIESLNLVTPNLQGSTPLYLQAAPASTASLGAEIMAARLAQPGTLERDEAEIWLRACAEGLALSAASASRGLYIECAWGFWRRARPNRGLADFAAWLEEADPGPAETRILSLARLAIANNDHARCRDWLRPHVDDPAFVEHRAELLLLLGMAETQLDDPAAKETLIRLIALYPNSPSAPRARMLLAWMLMMDGREREAAAHLRLLLAANPDEALERRARQMLAGLESK